MITPNTTTTPHHASPASSKSATAASIWMKHESKTPGRIKFSAEMSEIEHSNLIRTANVPGLGRFDFVTVPNGAEFALQHSDVHRREGDITHWTHSIDNIDYVIFND